jgi:hypothetical protein
MGKFEKVRAKVMSSRADANIAFDDLCGMLLRMGFQRRIHGGHHVFVHENVPELINLQAVGKQAKKYQVKQVRELLLIHFEK